MLAATPNHPRQEGYTMTPKDKNRAKGTCSLCKEKTASTVNINFRQVYLCEDCANAIMLQQAHYLARIAPPQDNTEGTR